MLWSCQVAPFMSTGFKARTDFDFFGAARPVVSGGLGCLICSLIDGLSVESNYPRPDWVSGDFVDCHVHTKLHKPKNFDYTWKLLASTTDASKQLFSKGKLP